MEIVATKFCSNCGAQIEMEAEICPECNARVALLYPPIRSRAPQGDVRLGFYIISFLVPIFGIANLIMFSRRSDKESKDVGVRCLILALISFFIWWIAYHPLLIVVLIE